MENSGPGIAKFVPSDMRARIVKEMIGEMGIRPLSNAIGVNPKTVYKYKNGEALPKDETFAKILGVAREKYPTLFDKYVDELRESFSVALKFPLVLGAARVKEPKRVPRQALPPPLAEPEPKIELPRPKEVTKFEVYGRLGVSSPLDRMKLAKILGALRGMHTFGVADIARESNLPAAIVEKYTRMLAGAGYAEKISPGTYRLKVKIRV